MPFTFRQFGVPALLAFGCAITPVLADATLTAPTEPQAKLSCIPKNSRFAVCGSASKNKLVAGFQIRFMETLPNGQLVQRGTTHNNCEDAQKDSAVPLEVRRSLKLHCIDNFETTLKSN